MNMLTILGSHPGEVFTPPRSVPRTNSRSVPLDSSADGKHSANDSNTAATSSSNPNNNSSSNHSKGLPNTPLSSSGNKVNFAPGTSFGGGGETSAFSLSPGNSYTGITAGVSASVSASASASASVSASASASASAGASAAGYRGSNESKAHSGVGMNSNMNININVLDDTFSSLRRQLPAELNPSEVALMERVFPFVLNYAVSVKTIGEIVWILRVSEEELIHVISKVPYLHIVKKPST